ncbi:ATP-dependent RNA helicase dbp7 [Diatrype stigma]|uniref:ATP-dependent RNA helicase n=1 Tax=Diatrype stigma TaxID=117547 RepID=A0AAN9UPD9_9PEZI
MADTGMLLNFDIGDAPLKKQVKFTGGRWRDRVRAQRTANNKGPQGPSSNSNHTPLVNDRRDRRAAEDSETFGDGDRPTKRQRTDVEGYQSQNNHTGNGPSGRRSDASGKSVSYMTGKLPPGSISTGHRHGQQDAKSNGGMVTSRLFTSNPTPKTVFEDQVEESEPAKPSNAPLSDEAANFLALGLSRRIAQHLSSKLEMKAPTSIQKNTIPQLVKEDSDAFLQAETGSGKTLAYLLPIVQRIVALSQNEDGSSNGAQIHRNSGLLAIVLAPTRELCKQIATVLEGLLRCAPWIVSTTVMGGESKKSEKARLRKGVNILIATPGRLADHLDNTKVLDVGTVRWLVLDEGDRLMELGFEEELRNIVGKIRKEALKAVDKDGVKLDALPQRRVTVLCSATMKMNVQKLGEISLQDATHITASKTEGDADGAVETSDVGFSAPSQLKQTFLIVPAKLRLVTLIALLKSSFARKGSIMKAIIFISCADSVDFHFDLLRDTLSHDTADDNPLTATTVSSSAYITSPANPSIRLLRLHGSLQQSVRTATLAAFHSSKDPSVLLTTDIASRGLDVPAVDLVVEYDPAFSAADHVHRVGRTARAGRSGKATLFLQPGCEEGYIGFLGKSNGDASSATPASTQPYEPTIQKGFVTPISLPRTTMPVEMDSPSSSSSEDGDSDADADAGADTAEKRRPVAVASPPTLVTEKQTPNSRAEALQLHLEQRLLASGKEQGGQEQGQGRRGPHGQKGGQGQKGSGGSEKLLDAARKAFRSHIRAYATHVRDERGFFDITKLHLGHTAKSFALREAPGGIGGGPSARRTVRAGGGGGGRSSGGGSGQQQEKNSNETSSGGGKRTRGDDDDDDGIDRNASAVVDEDAARRMRMKMKAVMDASGEFNIG